MGKRSDWFGRGERSLIKTWMESRLDRVRARINKGVERSNFSSIIKARWIEFLYVLGIAVMAAGAINAAIQPVSFQYVIYPGQGLQSATETVVDTMTLLVGSAGIYLAYLSGRQTTRPRMIAFYLVLGLVLVAISVFVGIYVYTSK